MKTKYNFTAYNFKLTKKTKRELKNQGSAISEWGFTIIATPKNTYWVNI